MPDFPMYPTSAGDVPLLPREPEPERPPAPDVALVLRPLPDAIPADVRLRQALKVLLRRFKLRCIGCTDIAKRAAQDGARDAPKPGDDPGATEAA